METETTEKTDVKKKVSIDKPTETTIPKRKPSTTDEVIC